MSAVYSMRSCVRDGRVAVLVELSAQSEQATRSREFGELAQRIALQIAACAPASLGSLLEQRLSGGGGATIAELLEEVSAALRERVAVTRFVRWDVGDYGLAGSEGGVDRDWYLRTYPDVA